MISIAIPCSLSSIRNLIHFLVLMSSLPVALFGSTLCHRPTWSGLILYFFSFVPIANKKFALFGNSQILFPHSLDNEILLMVKTPLKGKDYLRCEKINPTDSDLKEIFFSSFASQGRYLPTGSSVSW